ncbi:MAG: aminodeoxychorismate synthase component I [Terracidiphilus sp.]|nr:aminodeoxychorismate synthase component I [Terracidiphilus sp.]
MNRWHPLPADLYALVEHTPATVLLECAKPNPSGLPAGSSPEFLTRLFTAPLQVVEANQPAEIPALFAEIETAVAAGHFAAGFFAYECGSCFEPTAAMRPRHDHQPLAWFGIYQRPYLFDHCAGAFVGGDPPDLVRFPAANNDGAPPDDPQLQATFALTEPQYAERIAAIHQWIRAGDIYQLNFTAPMQVQASGGAAALYARLRARQPVEYGAFLHWQPRRRILSFSPELFFRVENEGGTRRIATRPMKGTAPRGRTTGEDRQQAEWLRNDEKNRSENLMIVDLLRNDLGRLARFGSVRVLDLFAVERYRTLWQMTSTVTAELRPDVGFQQIFRALFPCGSVTGAPKVRAMQLIAEIENQPRGVYTGAIGFFSPRRTVFSVAIRTLELDGGQGTMGIGSGIVIDSVAADEFRECLLKAEFLTRPADRFPEQFSLVETLLWHSGFPLIDLHLDRLQDSALYFGFPCDRTAIQAALLAHAGQFAVQQPRKVRLLLSSDGLPSIASEILPRSAAHASPVRLRIARERTDPADPMLFHKTTHRPLYAKAFKAAKDAGYDDVLFLNRHGQVTEGAISNIFVEKDGRWSTPPVECGLLPGVQRRHLLETQPGIETRVLCLADLREANAIYLANAVRGLRHAHIDWEE